MASSGGIPATATTTDVNSGGADRNNSSRPNRSESGRGNRGRGGRNRGRGGRGGSNNSAGGGGDNQGQNRHDGGNRRRGGGRQQNRNSNSNANPTSTEGGDPGNSSNATKQPNAKNVVQRPADGKPKVDGTQGTGAAAGADGEEEEEEVCFICANPVIHHSIAPCNHITCHICALRMRALYRTKDCPHCRTAAPYVIFTDDPSKRFEEYSDADISSTDDNIGIKYTNEEIVGDTILLLRYNCPDESCDYAGLGWPDLHRHVRNVHHKKMCDLCTRGKKVFTHEHELFTDKGLEKHMRHGDDRPGAVDQTGFKGHPLCGFCGERFYDDDKLYEHCRNKHERCFICDRRDSRQPHYYRNYNALEDHFRHDHYLCLDNECMEKKFVVFESELDLKAHQLSEHGSTLSKDVRRDVQVVSLSDFDYRPTYQNGRRNGGNGGGSGSGSGSGSGRGGGGGGGGGQHYNNGGRSTRGRDPNADVAPPISSAAPMRRDEIAYQRQRQLAIQSAQSISNRTFGSQLSAPQQPTPAQASPRPSAPTSRNATPPSGAAAATNLVDPMEALSVADAANLSPQDHARLVRHGAVIERASNLLQNNPSRMRTFRNNISAYRTGALTPNKLVESFFSLFADTSATALGSLVREVADLFEDRSKAEALRKAWQDWRAINEDYPSLPSLSGMHGATTSSSGWAAAAAASPVGMVPTVTSQKHSTRVLRLKHSTRAGGTSAAVVASSSSPASSTGPGGRTVPGATWTVPSSGGRPPPPPPLGRPTSSSAAFPALPTGSSSAGKSGKASSSWVAAPSSGGGSRSGVSLASTIATRSGTSASSSQPRRPVGEDNFPALPAAPKPLTTIFGYGRGAVRRDLGGRDTGFSWGDGGEGAADPAADLLAEAETAGKGKKKGKKVLIQWG